MARLNKKSTKAAFVKELKNLEFANSTAKANGYVYAIAQDFLLKVAKELEIEIKPEDYKALD